VYWCYTVGSIVFPFNQETLTVLIAIRYELFLEVTLEKIIS
jgi:hypothetical protein